MSPTNHQRKRHSTARLSSDTTSTLPEYITVGHQEGAHDLPSDKPPEYPDSAEEADEDTDSGGNPSSVYVLPSPSPEVRTLTPGRHRRFPSYTHTHRRRKSTNSIDPQLDSLLARSVHALEMSNTLLQSSMSTQSSLSAILTEDSPEDSTLETSARGLSARIYGNGNVHDTWVDNLEEISKGVEGLFANEHDRNRVGGGCKIHRRMPHSGETSISSSLPTTSPLSQGRRHRRRPSLLDLRESSERQGPHLHLSLQDRSDLVSPPPRALTQFVPSRADLDAIALPSTLGLRASPSLHSLHGSPSLPKLTDRPLEPTTPAYNMLSSFVYRSPSPSSTVSSAFTSAIPSLLPSRRNSRNDNSAERTSNASHHSPSRMVHKSLDCNRISNDSPTACRSPRSQTPKQIITTLPRSMTPPTEESSSSDSCPTKQTIQSLRKILDEQPPPPEPPRLRPPAFLPRTPVPVAQAGTSTATASVSRLFTKAKHSSSTRPPSPPPHSAMKQPTPNGHGARTPLSLPLTTSVRSTSAPSSGRSTPKRISFAKLPESYAESRPEGSSSKFRDRDKKGRKASRNGEDKIGKGGAGEGGWLSGWLLGHGANMLRNEERMEDRLSRSWSGRMGPGFGPTLDDWAI